MWLPTANNRRFAMSDEIAQDDEGFEIADFGVDEPEDEEEGRGDGSNQDGPRYDPPSKPAARSAPATSAAEAKPSTNTTRDIPRDSLDGDTIFAVGEEGDKWSDDDAEDAEEGRNLVGKNA